jgi:hypothetical protein
MTVLTPPGYVQAGTYSAKLDRQYITSAHSIANMATVSTARQGFYAGRVPAFIVSSGMDCIISQTAGIIQNTFATGAGDYKFVNDNNITVSHAASSPTLNRYDIAGFQVKDNFYDSSGLNTVIPAIIQGANSAGTPVDPALPASFIPVYRALVSAAATSPVLTTMVKRTTNDGGLLPVDDVTERNAFVAPWDGLSVYRRDRDWVEIHDGTAWRVQGTAIATTFADLTTAVTNPALGQQGYCSSTGLRYSWDGAVWVPDNVVAARVATTVGFMATTSGTTELNLPKLAIENYRVTSGFFYTFALSLFYNFVTVAAGDSYSVRIRRDTALSGTVIGLFVIRPATPDTFDDSKTFYLPWRATATDVDADFYVSVQRVAGTGTLGINGDRYSAHELTPRGGDTALCLEVA